MNNHARYLPSYQKRLNIHLASFFFFFFLLALFHLWVLQRNCLCAVLVYMGGLWGYMAYKHSYIFLTLCTLLLQAVLRNVRNIILVAYQRRKIPLDLCFSTWTVLIWAHKVIFVTTTKTMMIIKVIILHRWCIHMTGLPALSI